MRGTVRSQIVVAIVLVAMLAGCLGDGGRNSPPTADAGPDVDAQVGEDVAFDGRGMDKDGSVVTFRWDFDGDGRWDIEREFGAGIHAYSLPGSYRAHLQVVDDEGAKGDAYRWVNVTASVSILVNWTTRNDFVLRVSERLDLSGLAVNWTVLGTGAIPLARTYTLDAGLNRLNATAYNFTVPVTRLLEGQTHEVEVRLGDLLIGSRTVEVVQNSKARAPYVAEYFQEVSDYRTYTGYNFSNYYRNGTLVLDVKDASVRGHFTGTGYYRANTTRLGVASLENLTLGTVQVETGLGAGWGLTWWRWMGNGTVDQWGAGNYSAHANVLALERAVENGTYTKDDWHRAGTYSGLNNTSGTFDWVRAAMGNQVHLGGDGELYEVLKVDSRRYFEGTNVGRPFRLHNNTTDYDASRDIFENRTVYRISDTSTGLEVSPGEWQWRNESFMGYLDDNLDGDPNPDALPFDPDRAATFEGPRPRVVAVGDRFAAMNPEGLVLWYNAVREDTGNLTGPTGPVGVTGVYVTAEYTSAAWHAWHWFWVLEDGPAPGLVYEQSVLIERATYGGGSYRSYMNVRAVH
jgi:hypothetical protein